MNYPDDQIQELKRCCREIAAVSEGGVDFFVLRDLQLPTGCQPAVCDALLCPTLIEGYESRLYFAVQVQGARAAWNGNVRLVDQNWHAFSWRLKVPNLRLAQMVEAHLEGFTHV